MNPEYTEAELTMARDIAQHSPELAGRIYDGAIGMHDLALFRTYTDRHVVKSPHGVTAAMHVVVAERRIIVHWDECYHAVPTPEALETLFEEDRVLINQVGTHAMSYWLGPGDAKAVFRPMEARILRVDLDPATGSGAARWEGKLAAVESGYRPTPFGVWAEGKFEAVPHDVARVSYATARQIAVQYVKYGTQPEWISWVDIHPEELDDDYGTDGDWRWGTIPFPGVTSLEDANDITEEIVILIYGIIADRYRNSSPDWNRIWEIAQGSHLEDGTLLDLGSDYDSPVLQELKDRAQKS